MTYSKWTRGRLLEEVRKYSSVKGFQKAAPGAIRAAYRHGLNLDRFYRTGDVVWGKVSTDLAGLVEAVETYLSNMNEESLNNLERHLLQSKYHLGLLIEAR